MVKDTNRKFYSVIIRYGILAVMIITIVLVIYPRIQDTSSSIDSISPENKSTDSNDYLVTASTSQRAVDVAMDIIANGGSAMDAALSVALAEIAETGGKYVSYAGFMNLVYFEAETGKVHNMNAAFNTIKEETDPMTIPQMGFGPNQPAPVMVNGRSILVPGFMKGVEAAHQRFGNIPFEDVFADAIGVAENGIRWKPGDAHAYAANKEVLSKFPETKAVFKKENGSDYQVGDTFLQPVLAKTLRSVSTKGADYMYKGIWAEKFVSTARQAGSKITMEDLADYEVIWTEPVRKTFKDYEIYANGEPANGGMILVELLNMAEISGLTQMEHYSKSANSLALLYDISKASRYASYAQNQIPSTIDLSNKSRLKLSTSEKIWKHFHPSNNSPKPDKDQFKNEHSAAVVAVDKDGNMVALIHTINTLNWGTNGIFIDGVSIPDPATFQQAPIKKTGPGKRLPEGTQLGIVMKNGKPFLGFSCIGSGGVNQTFTNLLNVLNFDMSPAGAINSPSIGGLVFLNGKLSLNIQSSSFDKTIIKEATKLGAEFTESNQVMSGYWSGMMIDSSRRVKATEVWLK